MTADWQDADVARPGVVPVAGRVMSALVPLAALVVAAATNLLVLSTTWGAPGADRLAMLLGLAAGAGMLTIGAAIWVDGSATARAGLAILAGLAFVAPAWESWAAGPPLLRSAAAATQLFFLPVVAHLVLSGPTGRVERRPVRAGIAVGYLAATVGALATALLRDPNLDPACLIACDYGILLVASDTDLVRSLIAVLVIISLVFGIGLVAATATAMVPVARGAIAARWPILLPGMVLGAEVVARAVVELLDPLGLPSEPPRSMLVLIRSAAVAALAAGLAFSLVRARSVRFAVSQLATDLGAAPAPGSLATVLQRATGDPTLEVVYPMPDDERHLDAGGRNVGPPTARPGRAVTSVVRGGQPVAYIVHDPGSLDAEELRRAVGAAARMAIENERLQAGMLAQLADLRASRVRLVQVSDAERQRLERDLHDGAQQRLLALGYDLRLAAGAARSDGVPRVVQLLEAAQDETGRAIAALRDLAHGIYPAILTDAGLGASLSSLAETSQVPVDLTIATDERYADAVERTAYEVVVEAIEAATTVVSHRLDVRVLRAQEDLVIEIDGATDGPIVRVADRVGALGGRITTDRSHVRVEIPCASS